MENLHKGLVVEVWREGPVVETNAETGEQKVVLVESTKTTTG